MRRPETEKEGGREGRREGGREGGSVPRDRPARN